MGDILDTVLALNILSDIYFKFKEAGAQITPESLTEYIFGLEDRAKANNEIIGVDNAEEDS